MTQANKANQATIESYDRKYQQRDYYSYKRWIYRPFVEALIKKAGLKPGDALLDVGCGQGFFTGMFASRGLRARGVDLSPEGIASARRNFGATGATFEAGDIFAMKPPDLFDCVFVRSCSLYNNLEFGKTDHLTDTLLAMIKPSGCLIFIYNTNFSARKRPEGWIYHSLETTRNHFARFPSAKVFFSLRMATVPLGAVAFSSAITLLDSTLSRITGYGGDLVVFVRK